MRGVAPLSRSLRGVAPGNGTTVSTDHALQLVRMAMLDRGGRSRHYFSCISFLTDFTPPTALATFTASLISSRELTKPLN